MNDLEAYKQALKDQIAALGAEPGYQSSEFINGWDAALSRLANAMDVYKEDKTVTADFDGFTAKDLEEYFQNEIFPADGIEWDEMRETLENGYYTTWYPSTQRTGIKPFVHGVVRVEDDEETGGEGSQEDIYVVFSVTAHVVKDGIGSERKRYFRKTGYYASYDGSNWDGDFIEVFPKQKEITVWVTKKFA